MDNINIPRSQFTANFFHYFYASAKAALLPFLTLFFRQLGLSATQVGIIIAVKSVLAVMFASIWTSCATSCQKKRPVLMMSIFCSMIMCLLLSVVPPSSDVNAQDFCMPINNYSMSLAADVQIGKSTPVATTTVSPPGNDIHHKSTANVVMSSSLAPGLSHKKSSNASTIPITTTTAATTPTTPKTEIKSTKAAPKISTTTMKKKTSTAKETTILPKTTTTLPKTTTTLPKTTTTMPKTTTVPKSTTTLLKTTTTVPSTTTTRILKTTTVTTPRTPTTTIEPKSTTTESLRRLSTTLSLESTKEAIKAKKLWDVLPDKDKNLFIQMGYGKEVINAMNEEELEELVNSLLEELKNQNGDSDDDEAGSRKKRDIFSSSLKNLNSQLSKFQESISAAKNTAFILVLSIIIIGEVFSSCTEKLADKIWFDFLDGLDLIEKYGPHKAWYALGFVLVPVLVTAAVDHTPCMLPHNIHHFNIHFYSFAGLMGIAFIFAFIYPILDAGKKVQRKSRLLRGMKILFSDAHGFSYIFSVFLLGLLTASIDNYLFWEVQDLGTTEVVMGGAVTIAAVSEFFMIVLMQWFLKKISYAGAIMMALLITAVRLIAYSFLWALTPYVILPLAIFHALSHTLLLGAVENYPDFKVNPYIMDRSARSVLQAIYLAVGYSTGSALSGFLYDLMELKTVYQGGAIMAIVWCLLFALIHKCSRHKPKVRYARLLQAEADQMSDEAESVDDDWLEVALKHEK